MENEIYLDNLPSTANRIINVLWNENKAMTVEELTEAVNVKYGATLERREIQEFVKVLVNRDYVDRRMKRFRVYYCALGMDDVPEELLEQ